MGQAVSGMARTGGPPLTAVVAHDRESAYFYDELVWMSWSQVAVLMKPLPQSSHFEGKPAALI
jgi:hypothetical protein